MFLLGFICGLAILAFVVWLLMPSATVSSSPTVYRAKRQIEDVERQTIDSLLAAEAAAQGSTPERRRPGGSGSPRQP